MQLQQQFRETDQPGEHMVGIRVVKLFDGGVFLGIITSYDPRKKWYRVKYTDGDEEELTYRELRVKEWKKIPRVAIFWLEEKVRACRHETVYPDTLSPLTSHTYSHSTKRLC